MEIICVVFVSVLITLMYILVILFIAMQFIASGVIEYEIMLEQINTEEVECFDEDIRS